jgi:hypothetical protein
MGDLREKAARDDEKKESKEGAEARSPATGSEGLIECLHGDSAAAAADPGESDQSDEIFLPSLGERVKREWIQRPLQAITHETNAVMERIKDLVGPHTDDGSGYWIDGDRLVDILQGLLNNARACNGKIYAAFSQSGGRDENKIVERTFYEAEMCLERISSFFEIFGHESVKARLTSKEITPEGDSLRYVAFALIRDTKVQLAAMAHIAETGKAPLDGVEYDTEVELCL